MVDYDDNALDVVGQGMTDTGVLAHLLVILKSNYGNHKVKHHHQNVNGNDDHETGMISFVFTYMKAWATPVELIVAVL